MVATFEFDEFNGAGKTQSHGISNVNWGNIDDKNIDTTIEANKIIRGENSYTKYIVGHFSGTYGQIGPNGKVWKSAGSLPTGVALKASVTITYTTPVKTASGDSNIPVSEGTALVVQFGSSPENAINNFTTQNPAYSGYIRTQLQTQDTAPLGAMSAQTITLKYDES